MVEKAKEIAWLAEFTDINVDLGTIRDLNEAVKSGDKLRIKNAVLKAANEVLKDLEKAHEKFCDFLKKKR
jgi:DNA-directed RNA polymerase subunit L